MEIKDLKEILEERAEIVGEHYIYNLRNGKCARLDKLSSGTWIYAWDRLGVPLTSVCGPVKSLTMETLSNHLLTDD